jgi:hypothetical protein
MSWLLSRGYADKSTLKIVGDRYRLTQRQRMVLMRTACSDDQRRQRKAKCASPANVTSQPLMLDGYNLLITIEAALSHAPLFISRDGCIRDLASVHGTYRKVNETLPAIKTIAHTLARLGPSRLKKIIIDHAAQNALPWQVELVLSPDSMLIESDHIIATSDSAVIDGCDRWLNLARIIIERLTPEYDLNLLDLSE